MRTLHPAVLATAVILSATTIATATRAVAQDYPARPIRLVTLYAAGSNSDVTARFVAQTLSMQLKQPVLVENKGGAGGLIGTIEVLRSRPDGYTIMFAAPGLASNVFAYKNPQYKFDDFTPLGVVGLSYYGFIINSAVGAKTLAEFVAYAKANPGKLNYGSLGPAGVSTILAERLKRAAGINMEMVLFKGGDPLNQALVANDIQVYFPTLAVARQRMKLPQITALAVTSTQRSKILPDLPTFKESGYPEVADLTFWEALYGVANLPPPSLQKLRGTWAQIAATPEFKARQESFEREQWTGTLEQFTAFVKKETDALAVDFKLLNIQPLD